MQKSIEKIRKGVRWKTIPEDKIIGLCYDFMFCQVFGDKNLSFATNKLLADVTNLDLKDLEGNIEYLNRDLKIYQKKEMLNKVDILLKYNGEYYNIEMNTDISMLRRNKVYRGRIESDNLRLGDTDYSNIAKLVQINFNNFDSKKKRLVSISQLVDQDGIVDDDDLVYNISMKFANKMWYTCLDEREEKVFLWCQLMNTEDLSTFKERAEKLMGKEKAKIFVDRVYELSHDSKNIALYTKLSNDEMVKNTWVKELNEKEEDLNKKSEDLNKKSEDLNKKSEDLDKKSEDLDKKSEDLDKKSNDLAKEKESLQQDKTAIIRNLLNAGFKEEEIAKMINMSLEDIKKIKNR